MHLGRNHHIALSVLMGFTASFLLFTMSVYSSAGGMRGQLMAGDPTANRQFPTTLNAMKGAIDGSDPMISAMSSYGFWYTVILGGIVVSYIIFKVARRYI